VVSHHEVTRGAAESGLRRMVGVSAAVLPFASLVLVLANLRDYRVPAVAVAVWLAMFAVAAWLVPRALASSLSRDEAVAAVLIAIAAVATVGLDHRAHDARGSVNLAIIGTVWLLGLVALGRSARVWIPGALIVYSVHVALVLHAMGANARSAALLEAAGYVLVVLLIVFAALRPTLAMHAGVAAHRASLASRSSAERAAAGAVQQERRSRLELLEMEVLPLLRDIADGALNPSADDVRERCARQAAALRHSLTGRAAGPGDLVVGLEPALRAANARGLLVNVQAIGDPGNPSPRVGRAVLAAVDAVLGALPPHQVTLTVLASGDDVEMYLTFGEPLRATPDVARFGRDVPAAARWHAAVTAEQAGTGCLEISWRKDGLDGLDGRTVPVDRRH
jgi:hypothetical protein